MKVQAGLFAKALEIHKVMVKGHADGSVMSNVRLTPVGRESLVVASTNHESTVHVVLPSINDEKDVPMLVPCERLAKIVAEFMDTDQVRLEQESNGTGGKSLRLWCAGSKFAFNHMDNDQYTSTAISQSSDGSFMIDKNELVASLQMAAPNVKQDEKAGCTGGVCLSIKRNGDLVDLRIMATTGHHAIQIDSKTGETKDLLTREYRITISPNVISTLTSMCKIGDDQKFKVSILGGEGILVFEINGATTEARSLEGQFPDLAPLMKKSGATSIRVNRKSLVQALKKAEPLLIGKTQTTTLVIAQNKAAIWISDQMLGSSIVPFYVVQKQGALGHIAVNYRYLSSYLKLLHGDTVDIIFTSGGVNPVFIDSNSGSDAGILIVVMPLKMDANIPDIEKDDDVQASLLPQVVVKEKAEKKVRATSVEGQPELAEATESVVEVDPWAD